jgi:hypothetical protein
MQIMNPELQKHKTVKIVMDELIKDVLKGWGEFAVRFDGKPAPGPASMAMERAVVLSGSMQGVLILRCPQAFAQMLSSLKSADGVRPDLEATFRDFTQQSAHRLIEALSAQNQLPMVLTMPLASTHQSWPSGRPRLALALLIDGLPLEVRLWLKAPGDASDAASELHLDSSTRRAAQRRMRARMMEAALAS